MKRKLSTLGTSLVVTGCAITSLLFLAPRAEANPGYNCGDVLYGCRSGAYLGGGLPITCHWYWNGYKTYINKRWACDGSNGPLPNPPVQCTEVLYDGSCCWLGSTNTCDDIEAKCPCTQIPGGPG